MSSADHLFRLLRALVKKSPQLGRYIAELAISGVKSELFTWLLRQCIGIVRWLMDISLKLTTTGMEKRFAARIGLLGSRFRYVHD